MSILIHIRTLASRATTGARAISAMRTAIAAIAAIGMFSGILVTSELVGSPSARAKSPAAPAAWRLEARWWPGEVREARPRAGAMADSDLTFAKGYAQRVAAREAAAAARLAAAGPAAESQFGRPAALPKANPVAHSEVTQRVATRGNDAMTDGAGEAAFRGQALAFGEPSPPGFARPQGLFSGLFGGGSL